MNPYSLITELESICQELSNPEADNTAGRLSAMRYETLPALLVNHKEVILKALKIAFPVNSQLNFEYFLSEEPLTEMCKHGTPFRYECEECVAEIYELESTHHEKEQGTTTAMDDLQQAS
jgi:hypothetical protein